MVAAEEGAVGCALLKRLIHSNRTVSSPVINWTTDCSIRVYRSFSRDAAPQSTRFTAAPATFTLTYCLTTPKLPACNITRKNFMRIIGNDKSIK